MITVHHLNNSRSQRILWLLEELNLKYEVVRYERDPKTMLSPPALYKIHPLGRSPVLTDDGLTIVESGAIIEYILDKYADGKLKPKPHTPESLLFTFWLHYAEGSAMPPLVLNLIFKSIPTRPMPFFVRPIVSAICAKVRAAVVEPDLKIHFDFMESELKKRTWFAGEEFSAADIQMSFVAEAGRARGALGEHRPKLMAFLERIHARPAYLRALERGGRYDLLR